MQSQLNVEQIITRTRQYEFSDGLRDMQFALMWVSYGIMTWVVFDLGDFWFPLVLGLRKQIGPLAGLSGALFSLIPAVVVLAALGVISLVRRRWLWRKTGMVKANRILVPRRANIIGAAILLAGLGIGFGLMQAGLVDEWFTLRSLYAMSGVSFGYTLVAMGRYVELPRYIPMGWIGGTASLLLLALPITIGQFGVILGGMWGVVLVAGGAGPLADAIRAARTAEEEPADDRRD